MKLKKNKNRVTVTLERECTIAEVEADTEKLQPLLKAVKNIEVNARDVEEMDTAYFQLLLSLMISSKESGGKFSISEMPETVREIFNLYGIDMP